MSEFGGRQDMMTTMMLGMMPTWVNMMLPRVPGDKRQTFVLEMIDSLVGQGISGMTADEAEAFKKKVIRKIKQAKYEAPDKDANVDICDMAKGWASNS